MRRDARGFSLTEILLVVAIIGVLAGVSVPPVAAAMRRYRLDASARETAGQIATARLQAVTTNRRLRIRLNCPGANLYRVVEVTGDAMIDGAANRCLPSAYPYPDADPMLRPDLDGPLNWLALGTRFGAAQEIDISPLGRVTALTGALPAVIEVTDGIETRRIRITAAGQVQTQ